MGAACLGVDNLGELRPGWHADLVVWRRDGPGQALIDHPLRGLLAADAGDVHTVLVGGRVIGEGGVLTGADQAELAARARAVHDEWIATQY